MLLLLLLSLVIAAPVPLKAEALNAELLSSSCCCCDVKCEGGVDVVGFVSRCVAVAVTLALLDVGVSLGD